MKKLGGRNDEKNGFNLQNIVPLH